MPFSIENALIVATAAYLLGAVPFGLVITRLAGLGDIRKIGSGNIGATNVLRTGRKDLALLTLILDSGKAAIATLIALYTLGPDYAAIAGSAAFFGHCYPIYLKFDGGKGVATYIGSVMAINPIVGGYVILVWFIMMGVSRISSLSALSGALAAPIIAHLQGATDLVPYLTLMSVILFIRHKDNIERIIKGTEPKVGKKKNPVAEADAENEQQQ